MEKLNSIPNTGKWNEIATRINSNLSKIEGELTRLGLSTYKSKGYFSSEEELKSLFENPKDGDWAIVDGYIYLVENKSWEKTTKEFNISVELKEYIKKNGSADSLTIDGIPITEVLGGKLDANGGSADGLLINGDKQLNKEINSKISRILSFDGIIPKEINITINDSSIPTGVEEILFAESTNMFVARVGLMYFANWAFNGYVEIHNQNGTARTDCAYIDSDGSVWFFDGNNLIKYAHRNKNFTSNSRLNNVIKEIYIEGGINKELYITRLFHKYYSNEVEKNLCLIEIRDQDKNVVCVYGDNISDADHVPPTIVHLKEQNNSGISGYAVIEWDKVETQIAWFYDNEQNAKISPASNKIELCPSIYTYKLLSDFSEFKESTNDDINAIKTANRILNDELSDTNTALTEESNRAKKAEKNIEDSVVKHTEQELSSEQKKQARSNINAVGYSGTYGNTVVLNVDGEIYYPEGRAASIKMSNGTDSVEDVLIETKEKVDTFLQDADTSAEAIDKLKELQDYIAEDKSGAAQMLESIGANSRAIEEEIERATNKENEISDSLQSEVERAKQVEMYLESQKADKTGYYENMSVGVSDNLSGRGESSNAEFTMRPSGGKNKSIPEDGTARINSIKGNSVVWNNIAKLKTLNTSTHGVVVGNEYYDFNVEIAEGKTSWCTIMGSDSLKALPADHRYYIKFKTLNVGYTNASYTVITDEKGNRQLKFDVGDITGGFTGQWSVYLRSATNGMKAKCIIRDLTKMFGKGNEPTTVEEFELLYGNMPDDYNEGTIIDNHTKSIKSVGVNVWDEEWENGGFYDGDGSQNNDEKNRVRCKNKIEVIPNTNYTFEFPIKGTNTNYFNILWYNENDEFIKSEYKTQSSEAAKSPSNAKYMRFYTGELYGNKYTNDICIHFTHTGYLNGKYFPYEDFVRELPTVEGGLKSALNAYDEIRYNVSKDKWEYVKRIGSVDLGTLNWRTWNIVDNEVQHLRFRAKLGEKFNSVQKGTTKIYNILNKRYNSVSLGATWAYIKGISMTHATNDITKEFVIYDDAYTVDDAVKLKEDLSGVICYYELEEPIITELDIDISPDYKVWDYGTEEAINSELSTPVKLNLNYGFNAVGQITDNTILIEELLARVAQLEAQIAQVNSVSDTNEEE